MKSLVLAVGGSIFLSLGGAAWAQSADTTPSSAQPVSTQPAAGNAAVQSQPDATPGRWGRSGGDHDMRTGAPCTPGLSCDIYKGS